MRYEGGCLCGAVRYHAQVEPPRTVVCHCMFCQRCTGSAFAVWPTFPRKEVAVEGKLSSYVHRSDESGRWIRLNSRQRWFPLPDHIRAFEKSSSAS